MKEKDLLLRKAEWVIVISNLIFFLGFVYLATEFIEEGLKLNIIIIGAFIIFFISVLFALKLEISFGHYECDKCHHKFLPTYMSGILAPHVFFTRRLRCPKCNEKSRCKKIIE